MINNKGFVITFTIIFILNSCIIKENKSCAHDYIGMFKIDMSEIIDSSEKKFILQKGWDKVLLISDSLGNYRFNTNDSLLKPAEGYWYVTSNGTEGGCMGVIKQKNLSGEINKNAFSISVQIKPSDNYIGLPFRKILN